MYTNFSGQHIFTQLFLFVDGYLSLSVGETDKFMSESDNNAHNYKGRTASISKTQWRKKPIKKWKKRKVFNFYHKNENKFETIENKDFTVWINILKQYISDYLPSKYIIITAINNEILNKDNILDKR